MKFISEKPIGTISFKWHCAASVLNLSWKHTELQHMHFLTRFPTRDTLKLWQSLCKHSKHCPLSRILFGILKYIQRSSSAGCLYHLLLCEALILHCCTLPEPHSSFVLPSFIIQLMPICTTLCLELTSFLFLKPRPFKQMRPGHCLGSSGNTRLLSTPFEPHLPELIKYPNYQRFTHTFCSVSKCKVLINMYKHRLHVVLM